MNITTASMNYCTEEDAEATHQLLTVEGFTSDDLPSFRLVDPVHGVGYVYVYTNEAGAVALLHIAIDA